MKRQKIYSIICLASLLMFFQPSILFISDVLVSFQLEEIQDITDLGDQERSNNTSNSLEEEILHSEITVDSYNEIPFQLNIANGGYSFKMKTSCKENTTPPPKYA